MRRTMLMGLGILTVLITSGLTSAPPMPRSTSLHPPVISTPVPAAIAQGVRALPEPRPLTPSITIHTRRSLAFLASSA